MVFFSKASPELSDLDELGVVQRPLGGHTGPEDRRLETNTSASPQEQHPIFIQNTRKTTSILVPDGFHLPS